MIEKIKRLFRNEGIEETITWDMLESIPFNKWVESQKGIRFMKTDCCERTMTFITKMSKGASFGVHSHDVRERMYVADGFLGERRSKLKKVTGEVFDIGPHVPHEPYAINDTLLVVVFHKN